MRRRSLPVDVQCKSGLQMACSLDQSAMAAGRMEKPARFWRVGACSLIPWQSTDMQRLRRGMKGRGMGRRSLRPPLFFAGHAM